MPIEVVYCKSKPYVYNEIVIDCAVPPEYCMYVKKNIGDCKDWLKETHPDLYL